ncbi:NDP-hexose 2,3-dehydratase family protein [Streptomyces sp. NPDC048417]|uniref:NDP-hexose 2,3-dehydratase family protein n=1 Tax=Streptomyces sp. NPDC048417 TaxID=3155387 RepID=UPI003427A1B3
MDTGPQVLRSREDTDPGVRFARSAALPSGEWTRTEDIAGWLAESASIGRFRVEQIPFADLDGWHFTPDTGNLVHHTGRFFSVEGLRATADEGPYRAWSQPIIRQPEVGILGILAKEFDGVLHFMMQSKMEPGNPNLFQLSPTVQATRSNYTRAHAGSAVPYVEYFTGERPVRVLVDVLQSEHGSWFFRKSNRNVIVETADDIEPAEGFRWLTLGQLYRLLYEDNLVNMDTRTVLACLPPHGRSPEQAADAFGTALERSRDPHSAALHTDVELLSWFTDQRARRAMRAELVPLDGLPGWTRSETEISHDEGRFFDVVAVGVEASNREVRGWSQPLIRPRSRGVAAFLARSVGGVLHVLMHAKPEGGFADTVELGPTVQCAPDNHRGSGSQHDPFLDLVLTAPAGSIRYDAVHSEEGGRFLDAEIRYLVVEVDESALPTTPPTDHRWMTLSQLASLLRHGNYLNVQARTLVACLNARGWVTDA